MSSMTNATLKVVPVTVGRMESQTQNTLPVPPLGKPVRVLQQNTHL